MRTFTLILSVSLLFLLVGLGRVSLAKDVTATATITASEDGGKSITIKNEAGEEVNCKVSTKRTSIKKGTAPGSQGDLAVGKKVTVVYDDENPAKEAKAITIQD